MRKNRRGAGDGGRAVVFMASKKARTSTTRKHNKSTKNSNRLKGGRTPEKGNLREEMVNLVLRNGKDIIRKVIDEAMKGNYLPAKYLFEFAGLAEPQPETNEAAMARVKSLTEILLDAVQKQPEAQKQTSGA
ncbi:MAG: hypothetical protein ACE14L_17480 [Terriglobales bacterium]